MYQRILVPIDGSAPSDGGVSEALRIAKQTGASVRFFHVIDLTSALRGGEGSFRFADQLADAQRKEADRLIEAAMGQAKQLGVQADFGTVEMSSGRPADEITLEAGRANPDLIVIGTHGRRGLRRAVLGSDAESVARQATVPVLLVPLRHAP